MEMKTHGIQDCPTHSGSNCIYTRMILHCALYISLRRVQHKLIRCMCLGWEHPLSNAISHIRPRRLRESPLRDHVTTLLTCYPPSRGSSRWMTSRCNSWNLLNLSRQFQHRVLPALQVLLPIDSLDYCSWYHPASPRT